MKKGMRKYTVSVRSLRAPYEEETFTTYAAFWNDALSHVLSRLHGKRARFIPTNYRPAEGADNFRILVGAAYEPAGNLSEKKVSSDFKVTVSWKGTN